MRGLCQPGEETRSGPGWGLYDPGQAGAAVFRPGAARGFHAIGAGNMSDYLFMLESHLTPAQREALAAVERAAADRDCQLFLVGGAMRDMMGGFPIRDLDFAVQGSGLVLANQLKKKAGAEIVETDAHRKTAELKFPNGVTAEVGMLRTERFPQPGGRPVVKPADIHEDLMRRDFTINSVALSLHPASRGLLLDPANGIGDLERRELRANSNYGLYDDPVRILRLLRFQIRLGFVIQERTQEQYKNAREAGVVELIQPRDLFRELQAIAAETASAEVVKKLADEGLMELFSPALRGPKLNLTALARLDKARQMVPHGIDLHLDNLALFLYFLTEKLTPREHTAFIKKLAITKEEAERWRRLEARSRALERDLKSKTKLRRTSEIFQRLRRARGEEILFLYLHSRERLVRDRIRNFLDKHLYIAMEVTDRDVTAAAGIEPGHPEFAAIKQEMVAARLDGRKWRPPPHLVSKPGPSEEQAPAKTGRGKRKKTANAKERPAAKGSKRSTRRTVSRS